jgi:hypothetical protein
MENSIIKMLLTDNSGAFPNGEVAKYAWPGGYPLYYFTADGGALCPGCVNENIRTITSAALDGDDKQWEVVARDVNWEDAHLACDHCNKRIESAYAEDEVSE